jgi:uncharacterized protein
MTTELTARTDALLDYLRGLPNLAVAYSGGADSAFVLAAAVRSLGPRKTIAVTANSPSLAAAERAPAVAFAVSLGVRHLTVDTHELDRAGYRANGRDRCYFCKSEVLDAIADLAGTNGFAHVATGTNADDAYDPHRPGMRAADERGVRAPLREVGFTKADVRAVSRAWELPTWDKPAAPCLASRIAYGIEVTRDRLARVEQAEEAVRDLLAEIGVRAADLRVRDLGAELRVELDPAAADAVPLARLTSALHEAGLQGVPVTVAAYRYGALNY